ncbi:MAG: GH92 family glycosyl hydrolase [Ferruginibacter sp.]
MKSNYTIHRFIYHAVCIAGLALTTTIAAAQKLTQYVDPYIGTADHGHVFLGANVPAGAVQLGPVNIMQSWDALNGWDWCSGYNYASKEILGFTHTHLSGTGIGDLNDILVLPANGPLQLNPMKFGDENSGYGSFFSHANETARPGYYKVWLDKYQVSAELTTTERAGFHQYRFKKTDNAHILIDLGFAMLWDAPTDTYIKQLSDTTFIGYRFSTGWARNQKTFFAITLSQPVARAELYDSTTLQNGREAKGKHIKAALFLNAGNNAPVQIKVGISAVSAGNALANITAEIPGWNFDQIKNSADTKWNKALAKINITAGETTKKIFYTALYHSLFFPALFNDSDGAYLGADLTPHANPGYTTYNLFSLWDTYRGIHPLSTIINPEKVSDYINTFLAIYKEQGKLPVWHFQGNETNTMIGYPAVPVIADAILKGFKGFDINLAYEAMKHSAMQDTNGIQFIQKLQFIPADSVEESVAKAQEYAIADGGIALVAQKLGRKEDYIYFKKRAELYKLYYDRSTGFMRGRFSDNRWRTPFSPYNALHRANDYCEGNAWQYLWLAPHDVPGLIRLMGGEKQFTKKLDSLFTVSPELDKNTSPDISGMVGQYAQGNEPDHHIPYLYSYAGEQYKSAEKLRQIADSFFTAKTNGLCGNDDAGEMSAWYVFTAMGFYPVNPYSGTYVLGSPLVDKASIKAGNSSFNIIVKNNSAKNKYIAAITLNGKPYSKSYIRHNDIVKGGNLVISMSAVPNKKFGQAVQDRPVD